MNYIFIICILISSFSFLGYSVSYFISPNMKNEFKRLNVERSGFLVIILEILGALGLLVGLYYKPILLLSSGGLALLMFLGLVIRIKTKDGLLISLPATFYMLLNAYIFYLAINESGLAF
ncbi:DoxX family protein [Halpernia frigidisoli]|uniref:DoxX-like family protein n=1 Tax=Halpernia frigidisoli TaxID=1125876 RepID=A0A1I3HGK9_9FLAO|nr:DoxX family protein [Halpernia frigidisoli]SFI34812.1 DoxX-like family protein [Halpernia frigidisoli]